MSQKRFRPASLDAGRVEQLQALEQELGKVVVALEPEAAVADLDEGSVRKLQEAERRLGVVMVAYDQA